MKKILITAVILSIAIVVIAQDKIFKVKQTPQYPRENTVTMVDLGAKSCVPCKLMAPILEKLNKEYKGRADIVFIDVWQTPSEGDKYGIKIIPTQIFYDHTGKEISRHEGFLAEEDIRLVVDSLLKKQGI